MNFHNEYITNHREITDTLLLRILPNLALKKGSRASRFGIVSFSAGGRLINLGLLRLTLRLLDLRRVLGVAEVRVQEEPVLLLLLVEHLSPPGRRPVSF